MSHFNFTNYYQKTGVRNFSKISITVLVSLIWIIMLSKVTSADPPNTGGLNFAGNSAAEIEPHDDIEIDDREVTVQFWMKHTGNSDEDAHIVSNVSETGDRGFVVKLTGEGDETRVSFKPTESGGNHYTSTKPIQKDRWYQVTAVYDGSEAFLYINSELDGSDSGLDRSLRNTNPLVLGANSPQQGNFFDGQLDEVRIWDRPLTAIEIDENFAEELEGDEDGLVAYFRMNESSGDELENQVSDYDAQLFGDYDLETPGAMPLPPRDIAVKPDSDESQLEIFFNQAEYAEDDVSDYHLYRTSPDGDREQIANLDADESSYIDESAESNTQYFYELTIVDDEEEQSDYSESMHGMWHDEALGGKALSFNGENSYVEIDRTPTTGNIESNREIVIDFWMKHDGDSEHNAHVISTVPESGENGYVVKLTGEGERSQLSFKPTRSGGNHVTSDKFLDANQWYHVTAIRNSSSETYLYINGEREASDSGLDRTINSGNPLYIGANAATQDKLFSGQIDEVRIWKDEDVDPDELKEGPVRGNEDDLGGYWRFDEPMDSETALSSAQSIPAQLNNTEFTTSGIFGEGIVRESPELASPMSQETVGTSVNFTWNPVTEEDEVSHYELQIGHNTQFSETTINLSEIQDTTVTYDGLQADNTYYWRVRTHYQDGVKSTWSSPIWAFDTVDKVEESPELAGPDDGADEVSIPTTFEFDEVDDAVHYELQISYSADFDTLVTKVPNLEDLEYEYDGLSDTTSYYWRARAHFDDDNLSVWSNTASFTTELRTPEVPEWKPEDGADDVDELVVEWSTSERAETYNLQLSEDEDFDELVVDEEGLEDNEFEIDELDGNTTYYWRIEAHNSSGGSGWSDVLSFSTAEVVSAEKESTPDEFALKENYPNPFNPDTQISYTVPEQSEVQLEVYNVLGEHVTTLVNEQQSPGRYEVTFDASNLSSGTYIYRIEAGDFTETKQMMLVK